MPQNRILNSQGRPARLPGWAAARLLAPLALVASLPAQTPPDEPAPLRLDTLTVTGSNIRRPEAETPLPVTFIDRETVDALSPATGVEFFATIPAVVNVPVNETGTLGASARGDAASVALRALGTGNTLVLLNGRRVAPHPISQAEGGIPTLAVNVNQFAPEFARSVEVLRDGASAIYGTDATAGVINYLLPRRFTGLEFSNRYSFLEEGGGETWRSSIKFGTPFAQGRGHFLVFFNRFDRQQIKATDRDYSAVTDHRNRAPAPWNGVTVAGSTPTSFDSRSLGSIWGNFRRGTLNADGTITGSRPTGVTSAQMATNGTFFIVPVAGGSPTLSGSTPSRAPTSPNYDYFYNLNEVRLLRPATERFNVYSAADYRLTDSLEIFADLNLYRGESTIAREPSTIEGVADNNVVVPASNYWNPFGNRFYHPTAAPNADGSPRIRGTPSDVIIINKRYLEFGDRVATITSESARGTLGLRGDLGGDWAWEGAGVYSYAKTEDEETNTPRESLVRAALANSTPNALNPFSHTFSVVNNAIVLGPRVTNPDSVIRPLLDTFIRRGETEILIADLKADGALFDIPGGPVRAALGAEFRHETYLDERPVFAGLNPDPATNPQAYVDNPFLLPGDNDFIAFSPNPDTQANRDVVSGFAEVVFPLVGAPNRLPLVHALEFIAAGRIENYSDFGQAAKPKFSGTWMPARWLSLRASYNQGFRAPNLVQLFQGSLQRTVTGVSDPYRFDVTGALPDGTANRRVFRSGNDRLKPESTVARGAGVVVEVPGVDGLSFTVDWWSLEQRDGIEAQGAQANLNLDRDLLDAFTQAQLAANPALSANAIDASGAGNPFVTRLPVSQSDREAYAAYNARVPRSEQRAPVGSVASVQDNYLNLSRREIAGIDYAVEYRTKQADWGRLTARIEASQLLDFATQLDPSVPVDDDLGEDSRAEWRGFASLTWRWEGWRLSGSARYIHEYQDTGATTNATVYNTLGQPDYITAVTGPDGVTRYRYTVDSWTTYNAFAEYEFRERRWGRWLGGTSLRVGVNNLTNEEPPLSSNSRGYDTDNHDPTGRQVYFELTRKF